jgi:hypothetical protein
MSENENVAGARNEPELQEIISGLNAIAVEML